MDRVERARELGAKQVAGALTADESLELLHLRLDPDARAVHDALTSRLSGELEEPVRARQVAADLWLASDEAGRLRDLLLERTDDVELVVELLEAYSGVGAMHLQGGGLPGRLEAHAAALWRRRSLFDAATVLAFDQIVHPDRHEPGRAEERP